MTTRSSTARASATRRWRGNSLRATGVCWRANAPAEAARQSGALRGGFSGLLRLRPRSKLRRRPCLFDSLGSFLDRAAFVAFEGVFGLRTAPARKGVGEPVEIEIDHRRREQGQRLADDPPADHGIAERLADFRSRAGAEHQR